jgi:quercetin dioxygenase-like cupin family protein
VERSISSIDSFSDALKDNNSSDSLLLAAVEAYMMDGSLIPNFTISRSTFDDLSSTGNLKVISNPKLRNTVVQHYADIQKVQDRMQINSDWALALDTRFYSEYEGMKFVPWTSHLFPEQSVAELANELRNYKREYINNASAGYWVDRDALVLIEELISRTHHLIWALESEIGMVKMNLPDPLAAGWEGQPVCEVLEENDNIRVLKCTFPPGVGHERHYHSEHFGYTISGGTFRIQDTNGARNVQVPTGYSFYNELIEWHEVLNIGDSMAVFILIEPKI